MKYDSPMIFGVIADRLVQKIAIVFDWVRTFYLCWIWGVERGQNVRFSGKTIIRTRRAGEISLGSNVVMNSRVSANLVGLVNPTILDTRPGGHIEIGDESGCSAVVISSAESVKVGRNCMIGGNVRIFDHDFHPLEWDARRGSQDMTKQRKRPVEIGDDCFIGTNAVILKGSKIGARSIVAAGSVVFGLDVPPDSLIKGNPAEIIERRRAM